MGDMASCPPACAYGGGVHLRDFAPEQNSYEETSQRWRTVGNTVFDLTGPRIDSKAFRADSGIYYVSRVVSHQNTAVVIYVK